MKTRLLITIVAVTVLCSCSRPPQSRELVYPQARKADQVDDLFGTRVADPYRWLENSDSPETRAWIEAENKLTFSYLDRIPERARIKKASDSDLEL